MHRVCSVMMAVLMTIALGTGAAQASGAPRIPTTAAEWATFTPRERDAALTYEWQQFQILLASGNAHPVSVVQSGQQSASPLVSATYSCEVQWIDLPQGSYVRGGGWTDTSATVYYQYASRQSLPGQFLRDGTLKANWWAETLNSSHAESWTGYDFKWAFEHPRYVVKGWHGAELSNGTWILGPNQYCTVAVTH
jgi:hypothetical protein